jgi:hypothetical protein
MRLWLIVLALAGTAAVAATHRQTHIHQLRRGIVNGRTLGGAAAGAAVGQARNSPHEWGQGATGFAKRFGSKLGQTVAKQGIQFGVAAVHHENLHYQRSNKHGTLPRMGYALKSTFIVPKSNRPGKKTVALGRISGNMGAGVISRAWQPASTAGIGSGLATGGIGLGADVGANMAREFWPRKHHRRVAGRRK